MLWTPNKSVVVPDRLKRAPICPRCRKQIRNRGRRGRFDRWKIPLGWRSFMPAMAMASGDQMLDSSGNEILDASGNLQLSDGMGDACCCSGCVECAAMSVVITVSLSPLAFVCGGLAPLYKISTDPSGTYDDSGACNKIFTGVSTSFYYNDVPCTSLAFTERVDLQFDVAAGTGNSFIDIFDPLNSVGRVEFTVPTTSCTSGSFATGTYGGTLINSISGMPAGTASIVIST